MKVPLLDQAGDDKDTDKRYDAVRQRMDMLKGYEGAWIHLRRNDCYYVLNKITSMIIAITFAIITIVFKPTTQAYQVQ